ncbi:MAG: hypothetical protein K2K15_04110, partial [Anaeroplasmataceae bacterium]|nr:hypothetical protein [Anaeroplasmataceae bacterium]
MKNAEPEDLNYLISDDEQMTDKTNVLIKIMEDESFASDFTALIDEFEGTPFVTHLCLSSLTSLVNHIDVATDNEDLIGLVNQLFKSEDAIKVSDLATEADIKNLFKGLVYAVSTSDLLEGIDEEGVSEQAIATRKTKKTILLTQKILPYIQGLSLFQERADVGNKIIKGLYSYCSTHMVSDELELPEVPATINWINEFNVLLDACDPLLTIAYVVYDSDSNELISKFTKIFEGEEGSAMEKAYDSLTLHLSESNLLDVVFKSSIVGEKIDQVIIDIIQEPEAQIPKNIDYVGKDGECSILLSSVKLLLKNGGGEAILNMMESESELSSDDIIGIFEILTKEIPDGEGSVILLNKLLESKLLYYTISTYIAYAEFGSFKIYLPKESVNEIVEGEGESKKVFHIIKHEELEVISNLVINCSDLIINLIEDPENINYAELLTNEYINDTLDDSPILQGTIANVVIDVSENEEEIILPIGYDDPERWLSRESEEGEVQKLVHAIRELADVKIDDEYLVNLLLNGDIKAKNFLELENSTLQKLCTSKVLQYTISDMATRLGSTEEEFEIVVAYASLETVNAETTTSKTVNVIKSAELADIFIEIKTIIDFDENDEIKILY